MLGWGLAAAALVGAVVALGSGYVDPELAMLRTGMAQPDRSVEPIPIERALETTHR
jgi:hypothetical protein